MSTSSIPLVVKRIIATSPARAFAAFATAEHLQAWFVPARGITVDVLHYDFREAGAFRLRYSMPDARNPTVAGEFTRIEAPHHISFTWVWQAPDPLQGVEMDVAFDFTRHAAGTEVTVTHRGIPSDMACTVHEEGWVGTLHRLDDALQKGLTQ